MRVISLVLLVLSHGSCSSGSPTPETICKAFDETKHIYADTVTVLSWIKEWRKEVTDYKSCLRYIKWSKNNNKPLYECYSDGSTKELPHLEFTKCEVLGKGIRKYRNR